MTLVGYCVRVRPRLNARVTSVRLPADTFTVSNLSGGPASVSEVSTRNPIHEMPLGSVACTVTVSFASTRGAMVCDTVGGVTSFAADWTVTVTVFDSARRPPASTAKPVTSNVPVVASTVSVSVYVVSGGNRVVNTSESVGGVVGSLTALRGVMRKPIRCTPPSCWACTCTGMFFPDEASAPVTGASRNTFSAWTFVRKIWIVSSLKFPAPSVARPMMVIRPPAPDVGGKVRCSEIVTSVTVLVNTVSVVSIRPPE